MRLKRNCRHLNLSGWAGRTVKRSNWAATLSKTVPPEFGQVLFEKPGEAEASISHPSPGGHVAGDGGQGGGREPEVCSYLRKRQ